MGGIQMTRLQKYKLRYNITVALKSQDGADLELLAELAQVPIGHIVRNLILGHLEESREKIEKAWDTPPKQSISNNK
jgi:hypothetical protein